MGTVYLTTSVRLASRLFRSGGKPNYGGVAAILAIGLLQVAAIVAAAYLDHTWFLSNNGKGLLQHYGAWVIVATDPLILLATSFAYYRFRLTLTRLRQSVAPPKASDLTKISRRYMAFVQGRDSGRFLYAFFVIIGLLCWINNIVKTVNPIPYYRHDVFDAYAHFNGFIAYKVCLFLSWVIVYPISGYLLISISLSTWIILERCRRRRLLTLRVTHPDNCYGLASLGTLNISLLWPYLLGYIVIFSLMITHGSWYEAALIPLAVLSGLLLTMSYVVIMPASSILSFAKTAAYDELIRANRSGTGQSQYRNNISEFALMRLCYVTADATPYTGNAKIIMAAIRLVPIVTFALNLLKRLPI